MTTRDPTPEPNDREDHTTRKFTVRPSPAPVVVTSFLRSLILVAGLGLLHITLSGTSLVIRLVDYSAAVLLAGLGIQLLVLLLRRFFARYSLTFEYLIVERGVLSRSRKTIPIHRIQDVATRQSLVERTLGIGDVVVETAGEQGTAVLDDVPQCRAYSNAILQAVEEQAAKARSLS